MINEQAALRIDRLEARIIFLEGEVKRLKLIEDRIAAIERYLTSINPVWNMKVTIDVPTTPTGTSGTMTTSDSMTPPYAHHDDVEGWVIPIDDPVNVRSDTRVDPSTYLYKLTDKAVVRGSKKGADGFTWYRIGNSPDSYVREDVVTFTPDKPVPVSPVLSGKWAAPLSAYSITNRHGIDHDGYDLAAAHGASIVNPAPAFVTKAFRCERCKPTGDGPQSINVDSLGDGYGTFGILRYTRDVLPMSAQAHAKLYVFILYGHMSEIDVSGNFPIKAGSRIGRVGSTGNSTGPHLHMEARTSDNPTIDFYSAELINPILFFDL